MPKDDLADRLKKMSKEQLGELRQALKDAGQAADDDSDIDLKESIIALQKDVGELLKIVKPKAKSKEDGGESAMDILNDFLGVK